MTNLWTPWRLAYLGAPRAATCIFCEALAAPASAEEDARTLIVARRRLCFAILNRYPYSNGHVMVVPRAHLASLSAAPAEVRAELMELAAAVERTLAAIYRPDGFNLGMNLGRAAGAGVTGHIHLHVVPRWEGDTNYMSVVHDVRVIPERLEDTWSKVRAGLTEAAGEAGAG